jgi:hypothetical protein
VIWRPSLLLAGEQADFCVVVDARSGVGLGSQGWRCLGSGLAVARVHRRSLSWGDPAAFIYLRRGFSDFA